MLHKRIQSLLASDPRTQRVDLRIEAVPSGDRDALLTLLELHDLWLAPLDQVGESAAWQGHPAIAALKWELEASLEPELDAIVRDPGLPADPTAAMRTLATRDRIPAVYAWLADDAGWPELVEFLSVEGGPDGGFDDLVALCQVGLDGEAKVVLADNYWDEMGRGQSSDVHTTLHRELAAAIDMPVVARHCLPLPALRRAALNGLLATNRRLQPEMIGALGLLELQAGPRCRQVVRALRRLSGPRAALHFYEVHEHIDPHHGKVWVDKAIGNLVAQHPAWGPRIVRGAQWRAAVNGALFEELMHKFEAAQKVA
jgi:Iron-containing redox enzyme